MSVSKVFENFVPMMGPDKIPRIVTADFPTIPKIFDL